MAVDGRGGAGKSTLARMLADGWPGATVVEMDDFHRPTAERQPRPGRHGGNYDRERLVKELLEPVSAGRPGSYRRYDWDDDRLAEWHEVPADGVVIVEGVYSSSEMLAPYFDLRLWVDCPYDVRLARGLARDGEEMRNRWVQEWMPAEDAYVAAERPDERAELVLDGRGSEAGISFVLIADRTR